jgi:hypothetical protein
MAMVETVAAILIGLLLAGLVVSGVQQIARFKREFPPISDAEFLACCPPGTNPDVALKIRRIVAEHFAIEYERVHPSMSFVDDIGAD